MEEIRDMIEQVLKLRAQISQLEEEERRLRDAIGDYLKRDGRYLLTVLTSQGNTKLQRNERVRIDYDDNLLRNRLGDETWLKLSSIDRGRLKQHEQELPAWLGAHYAQVAALDRRKVKEAIEAGLLDGNLFKGAFTKEVQEVVSITRLD